MEEKRRVAVLAGTPVDTRMGVEYLEKKNEEAAGRGAKEAAGRGAKEAAGRGAKEAAGRGAKEAGARSTADALIEPLYRPVAEDCDAQVRFQYSDQGGKREVLDNIFGPEIADGVSDFFIYCNSLSGSFNFDTYALEKSLEADRDINIYTPLQVYRKLGREFGRVGVMAANNLSVHAIEEALMTSNPDIYVIGTGNMAIVRAIEDGLRPDEIVRALGLREMADYMKACGAEAIIIGCTHFPYFKDELAKITELPLIDPADEMYEALLRNR